MADKFHSVVKPLPKTREAMVAQRTMSTNRTLNDYIDDIHVDLFTNEEDATDEARYYYRLLEPVFNSMAVEGSLQADDFEAARLVREHATKNNVEYVKRQNLETIKRSLHVVWRRYQIDRKQRRTMVGGKAGPDEENGAE